MLRRSVWALSVFALLSLGITSSRAADATPSDALAEAVTHLLTQTRESGATFVRNGAAHDAKEAVSHMQKKYEHFLKKGKIKTPEDFIRLAATQSLISGKAYTLKMPDGSEHKTADWMTAQLRLYRKQKAAL